MQRMIAILWLMPVSLCAQWLDFKTPGIPRTADGKPNLTAPAPRTADGHPDLSGLWRPQPNNYWGNIIQDIKDEAIFTPKAQAIFRKRAAVYNVDNPSSRCLPLGPGDFFFSRFRIMQSPTEVAMLRDSFGNNDYREIFMDGRELPKDPNPTWRGFSVGHWEKDTLVVETEGFNDIGWLDEVGHPRSEKLHVTERFHRIDFGHIRAQMTLEDSEMLTRPLTFPLDMTYWADTSILERVCENERDRAHFIPGELKAKIQLSATTLAKYAGTYEPGDFTVSLVNGQLYRQDIPLFPQSETQFDSREAQMEFTLDKTGAVTGLTVIGAAGDERSLVRKR